MTAPSNAYADLADLKLWLNISAAVNDDLGRRALNAASRAVDAYCQRRFWLDPTPVARTFQPDDLLELDMVDQDSTACVGTTDGFSIATDATGKGNFDVVWSPTDYQLLPSDAPLASPEPKPFTGIRAIGGRTFPWLVNTWLTRLDRVQVTARWGWPEVPEAVAEATLIKAARLYLRKDSPQGVIGFGDFGPVRVSAKGDPDVCDLLDPYRVHGVLLA